MSDSTISSALDSARATTTPTRTGWPAFTGVTPDQSALLHLGPALASRLRVMDVRRPDSQTIAQRAAAELAAVGQRAAAHPVTPPTEHPLARHSTESMPAANNPEPALAPGELPVDLRAWHVAAETSAGARVVGASTVQRAARHATTTTERAERVDWVAEAGAVPVIAAHTPARPAYRWLLKVWPWRRRAVGDQ
jgi:hypothetical protein